MVRVFIDAKLPKGTAQMKGERVVIPKGKGKRPFVQHYETQKIQDARNTFTAMFRRHKPAEPFKGAVQVKMYFVYPFNQTEKKRVVESGWKWKTTRSDADNLYKLPCDVLTDLGFWADDALVSEVIIRKAFSNREGIYLEINELDDTVPEDLRSIVW